MEDFIRLLGDLDCKNVKTYIQTGNAVFQTNATHAAGLGENIQRSILRNHGFAPDLILLELADLENAIASNPYPEADTNPKSLHLVFLASAPATSNLAALESARSASEHVSLAGRILYFWAPEGVGRSKLFARIEKLLGIASTARNWRTVCEILNLAREVATTGRGESARLGVQRKGFRDIQSKKGGSPAPRRHQGSLSKT